MIRIEHLKKEYPNATPLRDVNAVIRDGDVISVIGPSGTGKSTLLRCINQLEKPTSGRVWLDDTEITDPKCDLNKVRRKMGMVFQSFNLFGHMTAIENVMRPQTDLLGTGRQEAYNNGMRLLRMVGLADKKLNYPDELSGGQKQRIAIARTLAMDPEIILLDEPTSALDPAMVGEVQAVIQELAHTGKTLMIVTHEMNFARAICNRVFYMDEGGIYEDGTPEEIFDHPKRENTRRFIRHLKVLSIEINGPEKGFVAMNGEISQYCLKNQIQPRFAIRIQLAFEELLHQLNECTSEPTKALMTVEYSQEKQHADITFEYGGPVQDITELGDEFSMQVLKNMVPKIRYSATDSALYPNRLNLKIRES